MFNNITFHDILGFLIQFQINAKRAWTVAFRDAKLCYERLGARDGKPSSTEVTLIISLQCNVLLGNLGSESSGGYHVAQTPSKIKLTSNVTGAPW